VGKTPLSDSESIIVWIRIFIFYHVPFEAEARLNNTLFKNSVRTAKKTQLFTITKIIWLTLFKEIIAAYPKNHTKPKNTLIGQN
jgi:hypothetical protein